MVISSPTFLAHEVDTIHSLFNEGLETFHLRKTEASKEELRLFLDLIHIDVRNRIMLHSHHSLAEEYDLMGMHYSSKASIKNTVSTHFKTSYSCHTIDEVYKSHHQFNYVFLSPIFPSISKKEYKGNFSKSDLKKLNLSISNCVALGGISPNTLQDAISLEFNSIATLGHIWENSSPSDRISCYKQLKEFVS